MAVGGGLLLGLILTSGCTSTERKVIPPKVLFQGALKDAKKENYETAQKKLTQILEDSPDSKERVLAQLLLADIHYKQGEWEEAKFNYSKFVEMYPAHRHAPRAQYFKALTEFSQIDLADRDQTFTHNAKAELEKLMRDYPESPYRKKAEAKIRECLQHMAQNTLEIGRFYYRTNSYHSAIRRFKSLLTEFPNQPFQDEVLFLLGESYYLEENYDDARIFYKKLLKEFPRSEFTKEARTRLRQIR
ncbi:MAG: outer membrane protein assembly factor BamD [Nitrospinaceae bacterium]